MNKDLNEFLRENRSAFDTDEPSPDSWQKIERSIQSKRKRFSLPDIYKWSAAAAILFIGLTCFYFLVIRDKSQGNQSISVTDQHLDMPALSPDYKAEAQEIYKAIATRQAELKALTSDQPGLYNEFAGDLAALDSSYRVLRAQATQTTNREIILKAMLQNLHLQAELLAKQLLIIQQYSTNKNETNEKNIYRRI